MTAISPEARTAPSTSHQVDGPVTLMNGFVVPPDRDDAFQALWDQTSKYFIAQPGFVSLRLHRAVSPDATHRWVNVANWESEAAYRAAHGTEEFRRVVTQEGWREFPSSPTLFEVTTAVG
jgi:heme-degrading monooxygenase HmoA